MADRQLHEGNYAAAAANYKRAWRIEERIAIARGRQARARLTMQAKNESIAHPRSAVPTTTSIATGKIALNDSRATLGRSIVDPGSSFITPVRFAIDSAPDKAG